MPTARRRTQCAVVDGRDARAVIAAIFQPFQGLDQNGGGFVLPQNTYNSTHISGSFIAASLFRLQHFKQFTRITGLVFLLGAGHGQRIGLDIPVTTVPVAVIAPSPSVTGATSIVFEPMKTFSPIVVLCFITPS